MFMSTPVVSKPGHVAPDLWAITPASQSGDVGLIHEQPLHSYGACIS
jgi:hypothetical protein